MNPHATAEPFLLGAVRFEVPTSVFPMGAPSGPIPEVGSSIGVSSASDLGNGGEGTSDPDPSKTQTLPETAPRVGADSRLARRYRVLVHNDDHTPMDFVVRVLTGVFRLGIEHAIEVMLEAHKSECALVRTYGLEEAEFRVQHSHQLARTQGYPLTFSIEPE